MLMSVSIIIITIMEFKRNELNDLIKEIRLSKKMNQTNFAKYCKLGSFQKVSNIERGFLKIGLNTLDKICKHCKIEYSIKIKF
jgi:transcriptional regulator with XRE-family HTH domain